jgi:DNA helicase-2/ATP-dependent DNA helicase PcrA
MEPIEQVDVGDKVKHTKFGQGTIMYRIGEGENAKAIVKFSKEVGEKKLVLKYAKLKKIIERPALAPVDENAEAAKEPKADE